MIRRTNHSDLLDCVLAHNLEFARSFLKEHDLPKSGTAAELRERLEAFLAEDDENAEVLTSYLDRIEGWGRQQVYLYKSKRGLSAKWKDEAKVRATLAKAEVEDLLNEARPILLPDERTLTSISWSKRRLRLVWTEARSWEERVEDEDYEAEEGMYYRAYVSRHERGTLAFDWDLVSGDAMLMIQQLPRGTAYAEVRDELQTDMHPIIDLSDFSLVELQDAITSLNESAEVRVRQRALDTMGGSRVSMTSSSRGTGIREDPTLELVDEAIEDGVTGYLGNFYWLESQSKGNLSRDVHTTLYAKDHRVGVFGELPEKEVQYVLGRIRTHC